LQDLFMILTAAVSSLTVAGRPAQGKQQRFRRWRLTFGRL
jgi:hypothetical protein